MRTSELSLSLANALLEAAASGIVVTDEEGTIVLATAAAASMLGWTRDELVGIDIARILTEPLVRSPAEEGRRALAGRRRDGTALLLDATTTPVDTPRGRLWLTELHDATERRRDLEALERSEAWLRELIEQAPDGIVVVGPDGRYVEVNASMCRLLGCSREELVGRDPLELTAPEDAPRAAEERARIDAAGGATTLFRWTFLHEDGTRVPTEVHARTLADGRRQAFVRDIREQARAEQALRAAEAERAAALRELEIAIDQCPTGIAILRGSRGEHLTLNRVARTLWSNRYDANAGFRQPESVVFRLDGTPVPPEELAAARALRHARVVQDRFAVRIADGTLVPQDIRAAPLLDEHGAVTGAVVIGWDVSAAVELERLRTEWSSLIAHDLRQPIRGISRFAQLAQQHAVASPELVPRDITAILELVARLERMIGDLLDFSRIEANRLTIQWARVDLVACIRSALERIVLEEPDLTVQLSVIGEIPPLEGDAQRLGQVVDELLSHARSHRRPGSSVRVHVEPEDECVAVAVTNEGDGIDPADLPRLFQRFERLDPSRTGARGIGLGLQITRGLVEAHGGRIAAESVRGGETTLRFTLPLVRLPSALAAPSGHR